MENDQPTIQLSKKEVEAEAFLNNFVNNLTNESVPGTAADIAQQEALVGAQATVNSMSIIFGLRYKPHIHSLITEKMIERQNKMFANITADVPDDSELSENYKICFNTFVDDSENVSIKVANEKRLGNVTAKDTFVLNYFSMMTAKRKGRDNMLQIIISGKTSVGKSTLFEAPLNEVGGTYANEEGVGRFVLEGKSTLLVNDKPLAVLYSGRDMDKFKAISRGEPINVKIKGKTITVLPTFLFVTSNQHLLSHDFEKSEKRGSCLKRKYVPDHEDEDYDSYHYKRRKLYKPEDLKAVKVRYIEVFVRQAPKIPEEALSHDFTKKHAIAGIYCRVIDTLRKYLPEDFPNRYHFLYPLSGLCKNIGLVRKDIELQVRRAVMDLMDTYNITTKEREQLIDYLTA